MELGKKIRALRKERKFSLSQLAAKSGVALATLSRIENGKGTGTFRTHQRIAEALDLSLPELYRDLEHPHEEAVLTEPEREEAQTFIFDEKASAILLTNQLSGKGMLPQLIVIQPGGRTTMEQYQAGSERWLLCLEGTANVTIGPKSYRIVKGGTLYFKASLPHQFLNVDTDVTRIVSVTSPVVL